MIDQNTSTDPSAEGADQSQVNSQELVVRSKEAAQAAEASAPNEDELDSELEPASSEELSDEEMRQRLAEELDSLIERMHAINPDYAPPAYSPQRLVDLLDRNLGRFSPKTALAVLERLRSSISDDLFDPDTWKGIWYMLNYTIEYQADIVKRRLNGEYDTDEWGFDPEFLQITEPFLTFMYKTYWRTETTGMENVPEEGRALLVCNHSGQLPWDGAMLGTAIYNEHPTQRMVRNLYATWFTTLPFVSETLVKLGQVLADEDNGVRLLEQDQLVSVFPEGIKGVGKLFRERYKLARFGRGGFVQMALKTGAPMIPVSIVGAEETYISLAKAPLISKLIGFPFFPITPAWPWLGPLGFIPLPTKWFIDFGEPIPTDSYGPEAANNLVLVSQLTDQVRNLVQNMIYARLAQRKSVFFG